MEVGELKRYFYPSAGGLKKKKKKGSDNSSTAVVLLVPSTYREAEQTNFDGTHVPTLGARCNAKHNNTTIPVRKSCTKRANTPRGRNTKKHRREGRRRNRRRVLSCELRHHVEKTCRYIMPPVCLGRLRNDISSNHDAKISYNDH